MPARPVPSLVKDTLVQDTRMLYLHSCKKIFLHRDYTGGLKVKFETAYPEVLRGMISEATWAHTFTRINQIFAEAEEVGCASVTETILGCLTCYFSRIVSKTLFEKKLIELNEYIEQQNREIYLPADIFILNPMERGLRVIEVCLLGTDPFHSSSSQNGALRS